MSEAIELRGGHFGVAEDGCLRAASACGLTIQSINRALKRGK